MPNAPDTIIIENARIYTMNRDHPRADALAIRDGRVLAVGTLEEVRNIANGSRRIDLEGRAMIPGLIDAHIHFLDYSRSLSKVNLDGVASKEEALRMVAEKAREVGQGRWVLGGGWNNNLWSSPDFPSRHDLDRVAPDNPVYLDRKDLHSCWVNGMALQRAGITRDTPDSPGAAIGHDEAGEPNGLLYELAVRLVRDAIEEPPEGAKVSMRRGFGALTSMGLVGFHDCEGPEAFAALQELDAAGELPMRVVILLAFYRLDEAIGLGLKTGFGSDRLRIGPVKIFSDGSLGSMTAEMLEPFEGQPGNLGISRIDQEVLEDAIRRAADAGIPCAIHAIGDAANRRVLDAFAKVQSSKFKVQSSSRDVEPWTLNFELVNRIEHAQLLHPDDIPRFAQLGVVASMQPIHATSDMHAADRLWGARSRYGYAWRSLLDAGALVAFGSDAPVETPNPFAGIHAAVTRQDANDLPEGGWYPQERLTVEEAVRAYTESAARSAPYLPNVTGTLTPGSVADLLVLDRDIFTTSPHEIRDAHPLATVVGGKAEYDPDGIF
ncbi:MAG TPA: amidohydrolase [Chloroflexia bacterium]|nr:amidohydrolase [Chloroflexia bacterium]